MTFSILGRLYSAIAIELWNALYKAQLTCRQVDSSRGGEGRCNAWGALDLASDVSHRRQVSSIQVMSKYLYTRV